MVFQKIITTVIIISIGMTVSLSQSPVIDISVRNKSLTSTLSELSDTYNIRFAYDSQLLNNTTITKRIHTADLYKAIDQLLEGTNLFYEVIDKTIVIYPGKETRQSKYTTVSGIIKDRDNGETLPYANIYIDGSNVGTSSNNTGVFSLSDVLFKDTIKLIVKYLGYQTQTLDLSSLNHNDRVVVHLTHEATVLDGVSINSDDNEIVESGEKTGHFIVNPDKFIALPNMGEVDIFSSLRLLPGISASNETSNGISIRGSTADQNLLLFDGFSLYKQDHCFGLFSAINSKVIKNIQVYKGGFESKFGGKVGGVIDITGKSGNLYKPAVHIGINMISANLMVEVPLFKKKGSIILAGRRSFTDILQTPLYNEVFNSLFADDEMLVLNVGGTQRIYSSTIDPLFFFYDLNSKITYNPSEKDVLSISLYSSKDILDVADPGFDYYNNDSWGNTGTSLKWNRQWSKKFYSELLLSHSSFYNNFSESYFYYDSDNDLQFDVLINDNDIFETRLKINSEWHINSISKMEFGLERNNTRINYMSSYSDTVDITTLVQNSNLTTGYFQYTFQPFSRIKVIPGLRLGYYEQTNKFYPEPRLSFYSYLTESFYLKAALGRYCQFVSSLSVPDQFGENTSFRALADEQDIPVISANHYIVGFNYKKGAFSFDAELYKKDIDGLTKFRFVYDTISFTGGVFYSGEATIHGMDIIVKNRFGPFSGWISYSLSKNVCRFDGLNMGQPFPANNSKQHELKFAGLLKIKKWDFSSTWIYGSGIPYSKPSVNSELFYNDPVDEINRYTLPDYHRLDISVTYNYSFSRVRGHAGVSVINVYNRKNIKSRLYFQDYDYSTNEPVNIPIDIKHLGFAPSLFLSISF